MSTYFKNIQFIYQIILNLLEKKDIEVESTDFYDILKKGVPKEILDIGYFEWKVTEKEELQEKIQEKYLKIVNRSLSTPKYNNQKINILVYYCNQLIDLMNLAKEIATQLKKWNYLYYKDEFSKDIISDDTYDQTDIMYSNLRIGIVVLYVEIITIYTNLCVDKVDFLKIQTLKQIMKTENFSLQGLISQENNYLDREGLIEEFKEHLLQIKNFTEYKLSFDYKWNL